MHEGLPVSERRLLIGIGDLVAVNLSIVLALRVWAYVGMESFDITFVLEQAHWFPILSVLWVFLASANNFYDLALTAKWQQSQERLLEIELQLLLAYLLIFFLSPRYALPRLFILYYAIASYLLIAGWRMTRPFLIGWVPSRRRVLVIGGGWSAESIVKAIETYAPDDYEIVGVVEERTFRNDRQNPRRTLLEKAKETHASEIVLATSENLDGVLFQEIMDCYEQGLPITPMPILYERLTGRIPVESVRGHWNVVLPLQGRSPFDPYPVLKRLIDLLFCGIGLLVLALLLPILVPIMIIDSPGPILFTQERLGKGGRVFNVIKLRTMVPNAEQISGPIWSVKGDDRVTRVGRVLRKLRIDEMPQFWNILRGEMSMVGPRPERPFFVETLQEEIPFYRTRLTVQPGLTGWAQVHYGYGSSVRDALVKLQYDLYYIRHRSIVLDLMIIVRTFGTVAKLMGR